MSIQQDLENWDGKSADHIDRIYERNFKHNASVADIVKLMANNTSQKGATWLLKRYLQDKRPIDESTTNKIFKNLNNLTQWESKLHLLQNLPFLEISTSNKRKIEVFLRICLASHNKFVRAWAYHGFYELSLQHPEYEKKTKQFFAMALKDEAPAVKARIKNILKTGFNLQ